MARIKFKDFVPRPKPKKRPRRHAKSVSKRKAKQEKKGKKWLWILSITFFIGLFTFMVPFLIALIWFVLESLVEWMG